MLAEPLVFGFGPGTICRRFTGVGGLHTGLPSYDPESRFASISLATSRKETAVYSCPAATNVAPGARAVSRTCKAGTGALFRTSFPVSPEGHQNFVDLSLTFGQRRASSTGGSRCSQQKSPAKAGLTK